MSEASPINENLEKIPSQEPTSSCYHACCTEPDRVAMVNGRCLYFSFYLKANTTVAEFVRFARKNQSRVGPWFNLGINCKKYWFFTLHLFCDDHLVGVRRQNSFRLLIYGFLESWCWTLSVNTVLACVQVNKSMHAVMHVRWIN